MGRFLPTDRRRHQMMVQAELDDVASFSDEPFFPSPRERTDTIRLR